MENPFTEIEKRLDSIQRQIAQLAEAKPEPPTSQERYLTIDETCELLSVTRPTLWSWNKKGVLESVRIGNLRRYRMSDIEALAGQQLDKKGSDE